jgi:hypothetical protein
LDLDTALLHPAFIALLVDLDVLITAGGCNTFASPVKTQVVDDNTWGKLCDYVDLVLFNLHD